MVVGCVVVFVFVLFACRRLMERVKDLQELCTLSRESLASILDNDSNASLLCTFLHSHLKLHNTKQSKTQSRARDRKL